MLSLIETARSQTTLTSKRLSLLFDLADSARQYHSEYGLLRFAASHQYVAFRELALEIRERWNRKTQLHKDRLNKSGAFTRSSAACKCKQIPWMLTHSLDTLAISFHQDGAPETSIAHAHIKAQILGVPGISSPLRAVLAAMLPEGHPRLPSRATARHGPRGCDFGLQLVLLIHWLGKLETHADKKSGGAMREGMLAQGPALRFVPPSLAQQLAAALQLAPNVLCRSRI